MSVEQLENCLRENFDLICFKDLADFRTVHSAIFKFFKSVHQTEYQPRDRLVFYTKHRLEQSFINHIQRAAAKVDISNFFILIVTPYDLEVELATANQLYGCDDVAMSYQCRDIDQSKDFEALNLAQNYNTLCAYPFLKLNLSSHDSKVTPCCKFKGSVGTISTHTISEIFVDQPLKKIRQDMLQGHRPQQCGVCWNNERLGTTSHRQQSLDKFANFLDFGLIDSPNVLDIDLSPTSICNFSCRICHSHNSTKIAAEELRYAESESDRQRLRTQIELSKNVDLDHLIFKNVSLATGLEFLHIFGGEPFAWPSLEEFLNSLTDTAKNIQIEFNSNGSFYSEKIINLLSRFKHVEIMLSIDDIGERFELQRGGQWNQVHQNIQQFLALPKSKFTVKIAPTINVQNVFYLDQLVEYCDSVGADLNWWYLENPGFLCIDNITQNLKHAIHEKYRNHRNPELQLIANRVLKTNAISGQQFLDYTNKLDSRRKQNFYQCHKELIELMRG